MVSCTGMHGGNGSEQSGSECGEASAQAEIPLTQAWIGAALPHDCTRTPRGQAASSPWAISTGEGAAGALWSSMRRSAMRMVS
mmetsp:Transcript_85786/g.251174  ORF Transcript_85786/g.251174 Transcript_85786/m.251174 type:complete len:83 (-) Transcript_85786:1157-1405(-)